MSAELRPIAASVAANVRAELARAGLRQADLASALQTSVAAVSRRLMGVVPFDVREISVVARLLDVPLGALIPNPQSPAGTAPADGPQAGEASPTASPVTPSTDAAAE